MSHFVAYILQFQEIIVYKIPPGGWGSIASLRSIAIRSLRFRSLWIFNLQNRTGIKDFTAY